MKWLTPHAFRLWTHHLPLRSPMVSPREQAGTHDRSLRLPTNLDRSMPLAMPHASFAGITRCRFLRPACRRRRLSPLSELSRIRAHAT